MRKHEKEMAEEATGCIQRGRLQFKDVNGDITNYEARRRLFAGEEVAAPGAGAGSYNEAFKALGFDCVGTWETGSSAGDWSFLLHDKTGWRAGCQENRYPYHGFRYSIDREGIFSGYETMKDLMDALQNNH